MNLTLFVPDLHWPDIGNPDAYVFPGAEVLARVLAAGTRTQLALAETDSWESRLADLFGYSGAHPPLAALRSLGDGHPLSGRVLCTDPVNLSFIQQAMVLSPMTANAPADRLSNEDTQSLIDSLNAEFADEGQFFVTPRAAESDDENRWYFVAKDSATDLPDLAACSRLAGRRIDADETRTLLGSQGLQWIHRIQMCLNQHPVNAAREAAGLPVVNSLWPWGLGQIETIPARTFIEAIGDAALLKGLCRATQTPLNASGRFAPDRNTDAPGSALIVHLGATTAVQRDDLDAWQNALRQCIEDWVSPALGALMDRRQTLTTLTLISPGMHQETTWVVHHHDRALRGHFLQRCLGIRPKPPALGTLLGSCPA
jgi:hypothetical protein